MAKYNKIRYSVSVSSNVYHENIDGTNLAMEVINENIRRNIYGSGAIDSNPNDIIINTKVSDNSLGVSNAGSNEGDNGWENGNHWHCTSNGTMLGWDNATDFVIIKNTGYLYDLSADYQISDTKGTSSDTVKFNTDISSSGNIDNGGTSADSTIAEIGIGEAFILPRPGSGLAFILVSTNSHMAMEITIIGT